MSLTYPGPMQSAPPPDGLPIYRLLTGPDDAAFCHRVSDALALGYRLYGPPAATFDGKTVIVAQALLWPSVEDPATRPPESAESAAGRESDVVSPLKIAASLGERWSPRVVAELDDSFVKVAKVEGALTWHSHDAEDELFYILEGSLRIEMETRSVVLNAGDAFVVPKGVRHNPVAERECLLMLIERKTTLHTGSEVTAGTRSLAEQLRPV